MKQTRDMTLQEIRDYVSPHLTEEARDADHKMINEELASVFAYRQDMPMQAEDLANVGEKLDSLNGAVAFASDFFEELEAITEGIREEEHETFGEVAKELKDFIESSDLHDWKESHCKD